MNKSGAGIHPLISLVLPVYNGESYLTTSLRQAVAYFDKAGLPFEIICVDDGSTDGTARIDSPDERVRIIRHERNEGKGSAIRTGMRYASGDVRIYTDGDLPYGLDCAILAAHSILLDGFHAVIGDRTLPGSSYHAHVDPLRRIASQVFSFLAGRLFTAGYFDSQCGFKAFSGEVAESLFPRLRVNDFACDVEMIYACLINRLDIKRIPVVLERNEASSVRLLRDSIKTVGDVVAMKYFRSRGRYRLDRDFTGARVSVPKATAELLATAGEQSAGEALAESGSEPHEAGRL